MCFSWCFAGFKVFLLSGLNQCFAGFKVLLLSRFTERIELCVHSVPLSAYPIKQRSTVVEERGWLGVKFTKAVKSE